MKAAYFSTLELDQLEQFLDELSLTIQGTKQEEPFFKGYVSVDFPSKTKEADAAIEDKNSPAARAALVYAAATQRDAAYALTGRKQMKALGYQSVLTAFGGRVQSAAIMETSAE